MQQYKKTGNSPVGPAEYDDFCQTEQGTSCSTDTRADTAQLEALGALSLATPSAYKAQGVLISMHTGRAQLKNVREAAQQQRQTAQRQCEIAQRQREVALRGCEAAFRLQTGLFTANSIDRGRSTVSAAENSSIFFETYRGWRFSTRRGPEGWGNRLVAPGNRSVGKALWCFPTREEAQASAHECIELLCAEQEALDVQNNRILS